MAGRNHLSPYATSFAALGRPIPVYLTAMADEFGGPIPVGAYAPIGGEEIGREPEEIPEEEVARAHWRYMEKYGQQEDRKKRGWKPRAQKAKPLWGW